MNVKSNKPGTGNQSHAEPDNSEPLISEILQKNIDQIKNDFGNSSDLIVNISKYDRSEVTYASVYITEMVDDKMINAISDELTNLKKEIKKSSPEEFLNLISSSVAAIRTGNIGNSLKSLYKDILAGNTVFLVDGYNRYYAVNTASSEGRAIAEPTSETIIKGPKDSFTENIDKNIYLIRAKLRNETLRVEDITIGTLTQTRVKLLYMNGIAKKDIVDDLRNRVSKIDYDGIISSGYVEEIIKTDPYSVFPTSLNSERPDKVVADLLEGRVVIICDGTPYAVTAPVLFSDFLQASDDYYENFYVSSLMRLIRYIALYFTLLVPATFVALISFHQEIIPTPLLISIAAQREGVPLPALFEILLMELTFEVLREAGIRMPRAVGSAISIVGALVLGQAAVEAGLVSAATVIVIALTAISSFAITNYAMSNAIRFLRFGFIILAGMLGLYGLTMGMIILILHLCKLKSASVPYMMPFAPLIKRGNKDTIFRFPLLSMKYRPTGISGTGAPRTNGQNTMDPDLKKKQELR